jgi:hypothetical protein
MSNDPSNYRRVRVNVDIGRSQSYVSVLTEVAQGGGRRVNLIWRGVLPVKPGVSTARDILELARAALAEAADRL